MEFMLIESFPSEDRSQMLVGVSDFILSGVKEANSHSHYSTRSFCTTAGCCSFQLILENIVRLLNCFQQQINAHLLL